MHARPVVTVLLVAALAVPVLAQTKPPAAPVREVTDTYFGQTIVDPYRWMEKADPEFVQWLRDQNTYSRAVLESIPGRDKLLARLTELDNAVASVGLVLRAGEDLYFYTKTEPGANIRKLYVRKGLGGAERLLVDPDALSTKEKHYAIDYFAPSHDGTYVIYGLSQGGSENSVLHVIESGNGRILPDAIDRTQYASPSWLPDGKSFFYWRSNKLAENAPPTEIYKRMRTYLHVLGNNPEKDRAVFGYGIVPEVSEDHFPTVAYIPGSPYLVADAGHGVKPEQMLFTAPVSALSKNPIPWKKIVDESDDVVGYAVRANDVYLLTHKNALRYKVTRTSLIRPDVAHAATVIAPSDTVVSDVQAAKDALYVQVLDGGLTRIKRVSYANGSVEDIRLPLQGTGFLAVDPRYLGAMIYLTSWTKSPLWYRYAPENKKLVDTGLQPPSPVDTSNYESLEVQAKSADGTMVPLSIVLKKGLPRDGSHPTLLDGYGAYGISSLPFFDPKIVAWLEMGGIFAHAHVRGGGEYGEEWHIAGQKKTKMNTVDDFIACAQYLIDQKFTSPAKLAGTGTSAGGILIGRSITKRPDLFAAAIDRVGASNPLRFEVTQGGPANIPEFGTVANREDFEALRSFDPYVSVQPNTKYPAVLLTTGLNGSTRSQYREELADTYAFLLWQFGEPAFQPPATPAPAPTPGH